MCVIAVKPKGTTIPRETLLRCFTSNPDGAGFVAARNGKLYTQKGFFTFDAFWEAYKPHEKDSAVIHFRIKTHGAKDAEMCHPFHVRDDLFVAHNGIIDIDTSNDKTKSDTWHFVDLVLKPELEADPSALSRGSFRFLLGSTIGYSKLAFLDASGKATIINKQKGEMDGKVWYSNTSFRVARASRASLYSGGSSYGHFNEAGVWEYTGSSKNGGGCGTSGCGGQGGATETTYATLEDVPVSDQWVIAELREFGISDDEILNEINAGTADTYALDLLVEWARRGSEEAVTKEDVAVEHQLALIADAEEVSAT